MSFCRGSVFFAGVTGTVYSVIELAPPITGAADQVTNSVDLVAREPEPDTDRVEAASRPDPYI